MDNLLAACRQEQARMVFIAAPNNPTGMSYPLDQVEAICEASQGLVVIDEAYRLFSDQSYAGLMERYPQVVIMHTLSKAFSLAGVRVGYLLAHPIVVDLLERVRLPYNVDRLAQVAATWALARKGHWRQQAELIKTERQTLSSQLAACPGITVYPSQANFILVSHPGAAALKAACAEADIAIRGFGEDERLRHCLRITVGRPEDNQRLAAVMQQAAAVE
jgi:histidinol-phosphate aminotransferase